MHSVAEGETKRRNFLAAAVLLLAMGLSGFTFQRLTTRGTLPEAALPFLLAFATSFTLALLAGFLAARMPGREERSWGETEALSEPWPIKRRRLLAALAAVLLFSWLWVLKGMPQPPLYTLVVWVGAMTATLFAFSGRPARSNLQKRRTSWTRPRVVVLLLILVLAGGARALELGRLPRVFSPDEASVAIAGLRFLSPGRELYPRTAGWYGTRTDPFGTGWYGNSRLSLLPAGVGAILSGDPVVGPRLPYALVGILSVMASVAVAALLGGSWAALAAGALFAFVPQHVLFSRIACPMVLDSLSAPLVLAALVVFYRRGSARTGALAGLLGGLALYGYAGGKAIAVLSLFGAGVVVCSRVARGRRRLLLCAILSGFLVTAGPNIHNAFQHFERWADRLHNKSLSNPLWWNGAIQTYGSSQAILLHQLRLGTLGLFSLPDPTVFGPTPPTFDPFLLPALGLVGLGWMLGRRLFFEFTVLALLVASNFAAVVLSVDSPASHRAPSLVPSLAILGGLAVAGFLSLLPSQRVGGVRWRSVTGVLWIGGLLAAGLTRFPLDEDNYAAYGGLRFPQEASNLLNRPRFRKETIYLHGSPWMYGDLPTFQYLFAQRALTDVDPEGKETDPRQTLLEGVHLFSPVWVPVGKSWAAELGVRGLSLDYPAIQEVDRGYLFVLRESRTVARQSPAP